MNDDTVLTAGSLTAIWYEVGHVIDEVLHGLPVVHRFYWTWRFCQWAHRYDWGEGK